MKIIELTETVGVAPQITTADIAAIAAAGYRVLVNNRPDGEESGQPSQAELAAAARAAGLEYHHLPVDAATFPGAGFEHMCQLLRDPARPVLAFCRTGNRSANLWLASLQPSDRARAEAVVRGHGFDPGLAARCTGRDAAHG